MSADGRLIVAFVKFEGFTFYLGPHSQWTCDLQAAEKWVHVEAAREGAACSGIPQASLDLINFVPVVRGWVFAP